MEEQWMQEAIKEAKKADFPYGAVIVKDNKIMENSVDCVAVRQNSPDRDFGTKSSKINQNLCNEGIKICKNNPHNTKKEFAALIGLCDYVVCNDSLALHVSIGLGKKTIALF